jgi:circadian clock protein KaiC
MLTELFTMTSTLSDGIPSDDSPSPGKLSTGVGGLDAVLIGGLPSGHVYLLEGDPGTGKTTLALQFLLAGFQQNEHTLYVTLSETAAELRAVARSHGWSLDGVTLYELAPTEESLDPADEYTILHPGEVELGQTIRAVLDEVERLRPARVIFDSLSELRLLARDPLRYRRQVLALKQFFAGRGSTVLLLDDCTLREGDLQLQSIAHGVIRLEQVSPDYGPERRRLRIMKLRGVPFRGGFHDFSIRTGGLDVFPRVVAAVHRDDLPQGETVLAASGVPELDSLLGGGLHAGTSTLLMGPAGVGKSTVAAQYAFAAAERGQRVHISVLDETVQTYHLRTTGLGIDMRRHVDDGRVILQQVDPAELAPGEFMHRVCQAVDRDGCQVVVIDSLNGYLNAMPEERFLVVQLHELLTYLGQRGVLTLMVAAQHGVIGASMVTPVDISYLADTVLLFRYFEAAGAIRQAISVVKKRSGVHERTIRELRIGPSVQVGPPLRDFHGILSGVPVFTGSDRPLFTDDNVR